MPLERSKKQCTAQACNPEKRSDLVRLRTTSRRGLMNLDLGGSTASAINSLSRYGGRRLYSRCRSDEETLLIVLRVLRGSRVGHCVRRWETLLIPAGGGSKSATGS